MANKKKDFKNFKMVLGESGTKIFQGVVDDEYLSDLKGVNGIKKYNEMRKSDGTIKSVIKVLTLPILSINWLIEPASENAKDKEIAEFIDKELFEKMSFDNFLKDTLLMLPFGVMAFEKIYKIENEKVVIDKLAPRLPISYHNWELKDKTFGIQQISNNGIILEIPGEKLLIFFNDKEGDNYWGESILRSCYKHYFYKNSFYKLESIAYERQSLGIPKAKITESLSDEDKVNIENTLKNLRNHELAYIMEQEGVEISIMDMQGNNVKDPRDAINHHNREITKSVLAQFLELGQGQGSFSLSMDQSELFLQSITAIAKNIRETINENLIKELVDFNYNNVKFYPKIKFSPLEKSNIEQIVKAYDTLTKINAMTPTDKDETYFRETMNLPYREENEKRKTKIEKKDKIENSENDELTHFFKEIIKKKDITSQNVNVAITNATTELATFKEKIEFLTDIRSLVYSEIENENIKNVFITEIEKQLSDFKRLNFQENNEFKSFRTLTFAEKKVDYNKIQNIIDKYEDQLDKEARGVFREIKKDLVSKIKNKLDSNDVTGLNDIEIKGGKKYAGILSNLLKNVYEFAKANASKEMGENTPKTTKEALENITLQSQAIANAHISQLKNDTNIQIADALNKQADKTEIIKSASLLLDKKIDKLVNNTKQIVVSAYVNNGRNSVFNTYKNKIYALQRSELLDFKTCNYCLSIDGRVVDKGDPFSKNSIFHSGCRGIWVEILKNEQELPEITGIPDSLRDRFGDVINDLIQPNKPIVEKDSPADKANKRRRDQK